MGQILCCRYFFISLTLVLVVYTSKKLFLAHETESPTEISTHLFPNDRWIELFHVLPLLIDIISRFYYIDDRV